MPRKQFMAYLKILLLLFLFLSLVSFGLHRHWKNALKSYEENRNSREEVQEPLSLLPSEEDEEDPDSDSYLRFQNEFQLLNQIEEDESWQKNLSLRRRYEKIGELYDKEMQRLVSYYSRNITGNERENFFAEQSVFLSQRSMESKKELSMEKTGVEENIDYLKKYIQLTKARCSVLLEKIFEDQDG